MSILFFSNFLIKVLCHSSANFWFGLISLLKVPPEELLLKNLQTIEESPRWYPSDFGLLAILNALSPNTLSEAVILGESLKSP